jgi:hypothetical protein
MVDADVPEEVASSHARPLEDCLPHDVRTHLGGDEDQLQGEVGQVPFGLLPQAALKLYLVLLRVVLRIRDLDLSHKDPRL